MFGSGLVLPLGVCGEMKKEVWFEDKERERTKHCSKYSTGEAEKVMEL